MPRLYVGGTITAVAPVAAVPTTAAHLSLINGEPVGGKTYTVSAVSFTPDVSAGAAFVAQLLANVTAQPGGNPPSGTTARGPVATDGLKSDSRAIVRSATTIVNNGMWHPAGMSVNGGAATATIAMGGWVYVRGIYVLPPGVMLSLAVLCSAAGSATCQLFVNWEEA